MRSHRTGALALVLLSALVLGACGSDKAEPVAKKRPSPSPSLEAAPQDEFVIFPETGAEPIMNSCRDADGDYYGELSDGGVIQLLGADGDQASISMLPSGSADPLSTDGPSPVSFDGDYGTGTATVFTDDGFNSIDIEFAVIWGASSPECVDDGSGGLEPGDLFAAALVDDQLFNLIDVCGGHFAGFTDYYAVMDAAEGESDLFTLHLELAETDEGDGEYVEITEAGIGGPVTDFEFGETMLRGRAELVTEEGDFVSELLFALDITDARPCD